MPTRKLVVRYEQDLGLFPIGGKAGTGRVCVLGGRISFVASDYWLGISIDALVAVVGSVADDSDWICGPGRFGSRGVHRGGGVYRSHCREPVWVAILMATRRRLDGDAGGTRCGTFCLTPRRSLSSHCDSRSSLSGSARHKTGHRALF